jgi:ribonuclease I
MPLISCRWLPQPAYFSPLRQAQDRLRQQGSSFLHAAAGEKKCLRAIPQKFIRAVGFADSPNEKDSHSTLPQAETP